MSKHKHQSHYHLIWDGQGSFRLWHSRDAGDQFEVIRPYLVPERVERITRNGQVIVANFPQNDAGELHCDLCINQ